MEITVAICTYNGEKRIGKVLDLLQHQVNTEGITWEVLVVDNNSRDRTAEVVSTYQKNWQATCLLRYVFEAKQGLAAARQCAIETAKGEWVGFLDDDNLPAENWLEQAILFGRDRPEMGAYGGIIHPKLDVPKPDYFDQIKSLLAVNHPGEIAFCYERDAPVRKVPAGAGCVIRVKAWQECVPPRLFCQGRDENNKQLMAGCGEDTEALYHLQNSDWQIWHNPKMVIYHHLEPRRLERDYLLKLARGFGLANYIFRLTRLQPWQRPFMVFLRPVYLLADGSKLLWYYWRYRDRVATDIATACELEARIGRFLSSLRLI